MAKQKTQQKSNVAEKEQTKVFTIGLKKVFKTQRTRRTNKAINFIREFMKKHFRVKPANVIISNAVNEAIWAKGREKIPRKIKVQVLKTADKVKVFLENEEIPKEEKKPKKEKPKEEKLSKEEQEKKAEQQKKLEEKRLIEKTAEKAEIKSK